MAVPGQIAAGLLSAIRGWPRTDGHNLEYAAKLNSAVDTTLVKAGINGGRGLHLGWISPGPPRVLGIRFFRKKF